MPRIAFLVAAVDGGRPANDNHERLPRAFASLGWTVVRIDRESLAMRGQRLVAQSLAGELVALADFDVYFVLGFGAEASFLDRMQLLRSLDQGRFVNTVDALVFQHGKASLVLACPEVAQPATYLDNDAARLAAVVAAGGRWIAKPPAGSFGREVFLLHHADTNTGVILDHLTRDRRYALLQEYVDAGTQKRVLVAGGDIAGTYSKVPVDHRGNVGAGAGAEPAELSAAERRVVAALLVRLDGLGVRFATVDLAGPCVLEINVANPGWLQTYEAVAGVDLAPRVAAAVARRFTAPA